MKKIPEKNVGLIHTKLEKNEIKFPEKIWVQYIRS